MNRFQFLVEMKKSLLETTKEIALPIVSDELHKLEDAASELVGIKWIKLVNINPKSFSGVQDHYVNGKIIFLFSDGKTMKAFGNVCEDCHVMTHYLSYKRTLKCSSCEKTYEIELDNGELACKRYDIKEKNGEWFIGM